MVNSPKDLTQRHGGAKNTEKCPFFLRVLRETLCLCVRIFIFIAAFFLCTCTVDLPGLFGSGDLNKRLEDRNNFKFLQRNGDDLTLSLGDEYSFIVISDTHIKDGNAFGLEKIKDAIDSDVKFVVICGDITQTGYRQELKKFIEIADSLHYMGVRVPCYPVIGNHDVYSGNWPEWKKLIGSTRYRVNGDGTTLFILDTANAYFGKEQLDWLEKEIKNTQGRVFVFTHTNLFIGSPLELQQITDVRERARLLSLLNGRCDVMFTGHTHIRHIDKTGSIQHITLEDFRSTNFYCRVSIKHNGLSWEFKKI